MGTRAVYIFNDKEQAFSVYGHWDGYPEHAAANLIKTLEYAWPLPRFEASDFAAAFIAANKKKGGGNIYLTKDVNRHADLEYVYKITFNGNDLIVKAYSVEYDENYKQNKKIIFCGTIAKMMTECSKL